MKRGRLSIAGLMGFVLIVAVGFGGLRAANVYWASGCFTLMVVALTLAALGAVQSRGERRAYWLGFAASGWIYFAVVFASKGSNASLLPPLLFELFFDQVEPMIHPPVPMIQGYFTSGTITATSVTNVMPWSVAPSAATSVAPVVPSASPAASVIAPTPQPAPTVIWATSSSEVPVSPYKQVAHCLTALLVATLGGLSSAWLAKRQERRGAGDEAKISPSSP